MPRGPVAAAMHVLYLEGDPCSPKYVQGTLEACRFQVDPVIERKYEGAWDLHDVYLLSDYRAALLGAAGQRALAERIADGAGLIMVGGWTSLGRGGYAGGPLSDILPVTLHDGDDRENWPSGIYARPAGRHPITDGLPFSPPPVLTGHNRCAPRAGAEVVLEGWRVVAVDAEGARFEDAPVPVLVTGRHGRGRVAVLATDLAPHWSGGWTDWGGGRIDVGEGEEVGRAYRDFLGRLVEWVGAGERTGRAAEGAPARR